MSFIEFYFFFFPGILLLFFLVKYFFGELSKIVLLFSSVCFLFYVDSLSFGILVTTVLINFGLISLIHLEYNKTILRLLGVITSLLPLVIYKFAIINVSSILGNEYSSIFSFGMPLGLAFYALQQITALFDTTKNKANKPSFTNYILFSFFFVYLPSGPLTPYSKVIGQFNSISTKKIPIENINIGISLFIIGLSKKVFISDPIDNWISAFYAIGQQVEPKVTFSVFELTYIAWGSVLQFYFEFSAYSDMAIGMAMCFGIFLPINFNSPLKASDPIEFINSWHMSFIAFVREYVFQPVFMILKKLPIQKMETRFFIAWAAAVFSTFFITGMWHSPTEYAFYNSTFVALALLSVEIFKRYISLPSIKGLPNFQIGQIVSRFTLFTILIIASIAFGFPTKENFIEFFINGYSKFYISLPPYVPFLENMNIDSKGVFPNRNLLDTIVFDKELLPPRYAVFHIVFVTFIVFLMPNSMEMFNLTETKYYSIVTIKWQNRTLYAIIIGLLFFISLQFYTDTIGFRYG